METTSLKRPASSSPSTEPVTPRKRQRRTAHVLDATPGSSSRTPRTPKSQKKNPLVWDDIPKEWSHNKCFFLELPVELLDKITESDSQMELQDHLALASTCRTLRKTYTPAVWKDLILQTRGLAVATFATNHIFSTALAASQGQALQDGKGKEQEQDTQIYQYYREQVIQLINNERLTKTQATHAFKISEKELAPLKCDQKPNPHARRNGSPMKLYLRAQVRSLALRIHGGPLGHVAHLKKRAETAEKCRATKERNGTTPQKKTRTWEAAFDAAFTDAYIVELVTDLAEEYGFFDVEDFSDSDYGDLFF